MDLCRSGGEWEPCMSEQMHLVTRPSSYTVTNRPWIYLTNSNMLKAPSVTQKPTELSPGSEVAEGLKKESKT